MINLVEWTKHTVNAEDEEEETVIAVNNMVQEPYWGTNRYTVTVATEGEIGNDSTEREVILTLTVNGKKERQWGCIIIDSVSDLYFQKFYPIYQGG